eukprot:CAMPEP_0177210852 /NCGR_PEP_ID=MMETSP0367-20130122/31775_1 /TAXON_ID=447022 ORGANISM="Scrippsiella hangoei-like, Strain SHHI-4" /NCGR_SAMPLE_ID=MMETSP0367 /ASSEMBLY_ACC=CAM_ASM_000362 /LENGTH=63 /DNA_ID=CAMNT_0018659989 /DNA_START=61 /DNA_END=252 /DNA_ORIENTATION=+
MPHSTGPSVATSRIATATSIGGHLDRQLLGHTDVLNRLLELLEGELAVAIQICADDLTVHQLL